ncbi:multidrug ABC transporter [Priestia veravalensis]|uniref:Multidrug ABC transporter n=1 Tax=Priestia veravalensis TaxID=1414648 RepID=A0A0V8JQ38_9BACI|nr:MULTISPECIES: ABC transporter ATP-binding protein [Priestia]KSU89052.1 multidrug ABC transporter [Priestia veravalensis]SCB94828.1 ATP-binding cassette, subfamily C [Priestia flexa]
MNYVFYFLKQIHSYAGKALYLNLLAMVAISLLEGVAILLLVPMLTMSGIVDFSKVNESGMKFFELFTYVPNQLSLSLILVVFVLIAFVQYFLYRHVSIKNAMIQQGFFRQMRLQTYESVLHANWSFFLRKRKSDLIHLLQTEVARVSGGTHALLQFMTSLVFTCIQIMLALLLSPVITLFVLLCGAILLFFNRTFLRKSLSLGKRNFTLGRDYVAGLTDQINGIKDIKSNTLEASRVEWHSSITKQMQSEQLEYTKMKMTSQFYYKVASSIFIALFIFVAIKLFQAQASQLMLIILIFSRLWPKVAGIQGELEQIAKSFPSFEAIKLLQEECREAQEYGNRQSQSTQLVFKREIACRNIHFRYNEDGEAYALQNINLVIPVHQMTALVGRSGAGKSTLIDIIMGLNQPQKGAVFIDGVPLSATNIMAFRQLISYVPQDPVLFNASIRENLLLVDPNATEERMWEALQFSLAADFVENLPSGLDTLIGDRGIKLSGGERQRLVLARAILKKPKILVLDEATSALDTENEYKIQRALDSLKGRMTIVVIAHRLSTIRNADQVLVLQEGQVIQQGEFKSLAADKGLLFNRLLEKQMKVME